jgi:hypothetical protein
MRNVNVRISVGSRFDFNVTRRITLPGNYHNQFLRDDYARRYPDHSFDHRQQGIRNKTELQRRRPTDAIYDQRPAPREIQRPRPETDGNNTHRSARGRQTEPGLNSGGRQEQNGIWHQPQRPGIERRSTEPVRQPREQNVLTRPDRKIEPAPKATVGRRAEPAPARRESQRVKTNPNPEKNQEPTNKKSNDKSERRRRE